MEIKGAVAIVTGSGTGIGKAIALEFAAAGMAVVCCARRKEQLDQTVNEIEQRGGTAMAVAADVTVREQVENLAAQALEKFGKIDVLFNNAGSFRALGALWEVDPQAWWGDVTTNLLGPMLCSRAVLPHMISRNSGIIINMNGGGSTVPLPGGSAYGSSKAALLRLTDTLARELERIGSAVMAVAMGPGFVRTEMTQLQIDTEAGQKWIPGSKQALEAHQDRPPEDCARATIQLLTHLRPQWNGRIFGVGHDFDDLARRAEEIAREDLLTLRAKR